MIKFVTGNRNKFAEAEAVLGFPIEQFDIDLPEVQSIDAHEIIRDKLSAAEKHAEGEYIVEDSSIYLDCLNSKLPGPLIKWFEEALGNEGIALIADKFENRRAESRTLVGFSSKNGDVHFFEGVIRGSIVNPQGETSFGWDQIFIPEGSEKTFAEMTKEEKSKISSRAVALTKLKNFIEEVSSEKR